MHQVIVGLFSVKDARFPLFLVFVSVHGLWISAVPEYRLPVFFWRGLALTMGVMICRMPLRPIIDFPCGLRTMEHCPMGCSCGGHPLRTSIILMLLCLIDLAWIVFGSGRGLTGFLGKLLPLRRFRLRPLILSTSGTLGSCASRVALIAVRLVGAQRISSCG